MAVNTTTIELPDVAEAPLAYKLKQAEALGPQSISATFDGTGASGSFLACCTFTAQDGKVIARCPIDTALNAGDVAEVTFAPFLRTASSGGGGVSVTGEQVNQSAAPTSVANSTNRFIPASSHLSGPVFANFGGSSNTFAVAGLFAINGVIELNTTPWTAGGGFQVTLATSAYNIVAANWVTFPNNSADVHFPAAIRATVSFPPLTYAIGDQFFFFVENLDGALSLTYSVQLCEVIGYA